MSLIYINPYSFSAPWTPAQLTTQLWLDADDSSTVTTSSGAVEEWRDKSGNGRHCSQATSGLRPLYTSSSVNGKSAVEFNLSSEAGHFLDGLSASALSLSARSCFIVVQELANAQGNGVDFAGIFCVAPATGNDFNRTDAIVYETGALANIWEVAGSTDISYIPALAGSGATELNVYAEVFNGSSGTVYGGGTAGGTDSSFTAFNSTSGQGYLVGARYASGVGTPKLRGKICEIIYAPSAVSTDTRQRAEGYLAHKWGLTGKLPADHPYKTVPPTA
jgi:hypothetical protein